MERVFAVNLFDEITAVAVDELEMVGVAWVECWVVLCDRAAFVSFPVVTELADAFEWLAIFVGPVVARVAIEVAE